MTITRLEELIIQQEESLSQTRHELYKYAIYNIAYFDQLDENMKQN